MPSLLIINNVIAANSKLLGRSRSRLVSPTIRSSASIYACGGGSALTDERIDLPQDRDLAAMSESIPITYVPARNTIFLSFALAYAEAIAASRVYIGVNALDYSGYPDCRPDYIEAMRSVYRLGTKQGREGDPIEIITPLIDLKKTEIIQLGDRFGVPWAQTWSCYSGERVPCGICDSCRLRLAAFEELGKVDPGRG